MKLGNIANPIQVVAGAIWSVNEENEGTPIGLGDVDSVAEKSSRGRNVVVNKYVFSLHDLDNVNPNIRNT
jgi:hypothetical protein